MLQRRIHPRVERLLRAAATVAETTTTRATAEKAAHRPAEGIRSELAVPVAIRPTTRSQAEAVEALGHVRRSLVAKALQVPTESVVALIPIMEAAPGPSAAVSIPGCQATAGGPDMADLAQTTTGIRTCREAHCRVD